ncbi:hypothetical protein LEP1GSC071_0172 [Leptospira santarosai str. JET]|nr:hypothetical protein LEP1GSC071_0172 [Leptospira santarosai str. JET]
MPREVQKNMLIFGLLSSRFAFEAGPAIVLAIYFLYKPNSALTIVDRSGIAHDENIVGI